MTTTFPPCHRCQHPEDQHHDYDGGCLVESCDCWSFSIPPQPEPDPIVDDSGYSRLVEHLDDIDLASGFFGDS